jgi:hypothetical protein
MTSVREAKITNPGERYHRAFLIEPSPSRYVHVAVQVDPAITTGLERWSLGAGRSTGRGEPVSALSGTF